MLPMPAMIIGVSVLCLLLAESASPQETQASWPAEFGFSLGGGGFYQPDHYGGWQVGGSGAATWYPREPLVDDGTPLSLQSYLQRLDRLSFGVGVSGFSAKDNLSFYEHQGHTADLALSGLFYSHDLVLGGGLHYVRDYDFQHPAPASGLSADEEHTTQLIYPELTIGVRSDDLQFQGSYRFMTYFDDGTLRSPRWGQVLVLGEGTVEREMFWGISGYTIPDGGGGSVSLEFHPTPRSGIWFTGFYESGQLYSNSQSDYTREGLEWGVSWWESSRLELKFSIGVTVASPQVPGAPSLITGLGNFGIVMRGPQRQRKRVVAPPDEPGLPRLPPQPTPPAQPVAPSQPQLPPPPALTPGHQQPEPIPAPPAPPPPPGAVTPEPPSEPPVVSPPPTEARPDEGTPE